jgi:hypothetical protein
MNTRKKYQDNHTYFPQPLDNLPFPEPCANELGDHGKVYLQVYTQRDRVIPGKQTPCV